MNRVSDISGGKEKAVERDEQDEQGVQKASLPQSNTHIADSGISVVYEPELSEPVIDIAFIHGLQGHPFKTWAVAAHHDYRVAPIPPEKDGALVGSGAPEVGRKASKKVRSFFSRTKQYRKAAHVSSEQRYCVFWPRDLLPLQCPKARIMVLGYDKIIAKHQFAGSANKNSIFAHSRNLVNDLSRSRTLGRPILFVVHSLGGIVIKEMLSICSTSNNQSFEDILKSTAGVIFLGTPHRGSSAAGVGEIARKAASMLLMDTNPRILDSLSLKNSDLERCQETFSSLWNKHGFQVKTFQEGLPLKLPIRLGQSKMAKIVPDISSCIGDSRERAEILDADHRSMCRYAGARDPNYRKVSDEVRSIYSGYVHDNHRETMSRTSLPSAVNPILSHNKQEILDHFRFSEMRLRQLAIDPPAKNTCQWLPRSVAFGQWIERKNVGVHFGLLQIIGKPGCGKSTLMKRLFETTLSSLRAEGTCVAGFFFNARGGELEHCARGLFRSLLFQVGISHPACLDSIQEHSITELSTMERANPRVYVRILKSILQEIFSNKSVAPQKTILFIDALDECDHNETSETGHFFAELAESAYQAGVKLNVCISRREYPPIILRKCLEIQMKDFNTDDIRRYIHEKLDLVEFEPPKAKILADMITQRSNGIFLWVVLAVEGIMKDVQDGKNTKYILKKLPKALEDLYASMLKNIDPNNRQMALRLFYWAILATGRLRLREWHHILAFIREDPPSSLKGWKESDYYTENDSQLEQQIKSLSQGLVEVKEVLKFWKRSMTQNLCSPVPAR
ncbi:hypothetical protein M434DRAFT_191505 [Hypoxylon sp. CO27-5]|nr:hypothetical protein M434DRAFT_191505 [Hypoxylon sp. CO27-5]